MIQGHRVTLRPFTRADLPALRRWHADGTVMQYWGARLPLLTEDQFAADLAPGGRFATFDARGTFCLCDAAGRPLGLVQYDGTAWGGGPRDRRAHLGILIGEPDAWGHGYGPAALVLLLNWLFNHQGYRRAWLTVQADNPRACRAYEKVGFRREGTLRAHNFHDAHAHDEHLYGLLADEFNALYRPDRTDWLVSGTPPDQ